MDALVGLFKRCGLVTNTKKTEGMNGIAGKIRASLSKEAYPSRIKGCHGFQKHQRRKVTCDVCKADLTAGSLGTHMEKHHGTPRYFVLNKE